MASAEAGNRTAIAAVLGIIAFTLTPVLGLLALAGVGEPAAQTPTTAVAGVPARVAAAYQSAAGRCSGLDWTVLAAVGAVETNHGQHAGSTVDPTTGEARPWIFGPDLDGTNGTASMPIGEQLGWWGLTGPWLQAVGPMQFLPATFDAHAQDADGDGVANPHDIDDAVATAAELICAGAGGAVDGLDEVARIYNPGDAERYGDQLAAARDRISAAAPVGGRPTTASRCPVVGPVSFSNTWGAARSGGRAHQGVDMFATHGTPVVAVADGTVEHYVTSLGGLSYGLHADDGTYYYGTHLSAYENEDAGHVAAGTVLGYVGTTGNAASTPAHLHWQIHPAGRGTPAVDPTPLAQMLCPPTPS